MKTCSHTAVNTINCGKSLLYARVLLYITLPACQVLPNANAIALCVCLCTVHAFYGHHQILCLHCYVIS